MDERLKAIEQRNEELERRLRHVERQVLGAATVPVLGAAEAPPAERARWVEPPASLDSRDVIRAGAAGAGSALVAGFSGARDGWSQVIFWS